MGRKGGAQDGRREEQRQGNRQQWPVAPPGRNLANFVRLAGSSHPV
jgi:hypothetical protein